MSISSLFDVVIYGAGPIGTMLASALPPALKIGLIKLPIDASKPPPSHTLALTRYSKLWLQRHRLWPENAIQRGSIQSIRVSQKGSFGNSTLRPKYGAPFAHTLDYQQLCQHLQAQFEAHTQKNPTKIWLAGHLQSITQEANCIRLTLSHDNASIATKILIMATGYIPTDSSEQSDPVTKLSFDQQTLTTWISCASPTSTTAFERFMPNAEAIALLPIHTPKGPGFSCIWSVAQERAEKLLRLSSTDFLSTLQTEFGYQAGHFKACSSVQAYQLTARFKQKISQQRTFYVGNAAQTLHPMAGQGLNLGIRDIACLTELLSRPNFGQDAASIALLEKKYSQVRCHDRVKTFGITSALVKGFGLKWPGISNFRSGLLTLLDISPITKELFIHSMT